MSTSIIDAFLSRATGSPHAVFLGVGLGGMSYFLWGNIGCHFSGAMTFAINPEERKKLGFDTSKAVELFAWAYGRGARHFGVSSAVASLSLLAAAFTAPPSQSPALRNHLFILSPMILTIGLYTVVFLLPVNNALLALKDRVVKTRSTADSPPLTAAQEHEAETLLQKWRKLHLIRMGLGAVGWIGALAAYTLSV